MLTPEIEETALHLIHTIAWALIDDPHNLNVTASAGVEGTTIIAVHCAPADIGKLIGKQGRTARCIRTLLSGYGHKVRHSFTLDIHED